MRLVKILGGRGGGSDGGENKEHEEFQATSNITKEGEGRRETLISVERDR